MSNTIRKIMEEYQSQGLTIAQARSLAERRIRCCKISLLDFIYKL